MNPFLIFLKIYFLIIFQVIVVSILKKSYINILLFMLHTHIRQCI